MSASYKIEVGCHCAPKDPLACQIHSADPVKRAAAWQYRCELAEKSLASEKGAGRGGARKCPDCGSLWFDRGGAAALDEAREEGFREGVEAAASFVRGPDCYGLFKSEGTQRAVADSMVAVLSPPSPSTTAPSDGRTE